MGERKVLNKYFPPDFDPAKLPKGKRPDHNMMKVRMMLPMSIRCQTCGTFMMKGTKFNMRKEDAEGEKYLGIQVLRFYMRCSACSAEITMKTDWQNADYTMERGATRNYEPWREKDKAIAEAVAKREEEEKGNAMKALENRTLDSKREMDILAALDEMRSLNARHERLDPEAALAALRQQAETNEEALEAEDEAAIREYVLQRSRVKRVQVPDEGPAPRDGQNGAASKPAVKADAEAKGNERGKPVAAPLPKPRGPPILVKKRKFDDSGGASSDPKRGGTVPLGGGASTSGAGASAPLAVTAGKPAAPSGAKEAVVGGDSGSEGGGLAGLLGGYGSSDSDQ